jgi:hypothetical protein
VSPELAELAELGAVAAMGTEEQYRLPDLTYLGLQLHAADATFESIRLRMTSGRARLVR